MQFNTCLINVYVITKHKNKLVVANRSGVGKNVLNVTFGDNYKK